MEGPDQTDLGKKLDAAHREDRTARERDEVNDVVSPRLAEVDDEVGVLLADLGASAARALEARLLDEPPGEVALRVDEHRPRVRQAERLGGAAAIHVGFRYAHVLVLLAVAPAADPAAGPGEDGSARKLAMAVGELQLRRGQPVQAVRSGHLDGVEMVLCRTGVGPGVHRHHAADRSRDARRPGDAHPALLPGQGDETRDRRPGAEDQHRMIAALLDRLVDEVAGELQHAALDPAVADDGVGAAAEGEPGDAGVAEDAEHRDERLGIARAHPELRRAADPDAGARGERHSFEHLAPGHAPERGKELAHARSPRRARSSSPRWVMSPAPRVSTRSPSRTLSRSTWASGARSGTNQASRCPQARTASCSLAPLTPGMGSSPAA